MAKRRIVAVWVVTRRIRWPDAVFRKTSLSCWWDFTHYIAPTIFQSRRESLGHVSEKAKQGDPSGHLDCNIVIMESC